jgi:hypothetical protein
MTNLIDSIQYHLPSDTLHAGILQTLKRPGNDDALNLHNGLEIRTRGTTPWSCLPPHYVQKVHHSS